MNLKETAHSLKLECIEQGDRVCIRPMHFDKDGIRVVRYYPDPNEFIGRFEAEQLLRKLGAQ